VNYTLWHTYDSAGNLATEVHSSGDCRQYTYDVRNKMVQYAVSGVVQATYAYNDAGERVSETVGGVTTYYLADTQNPTGYDQPIEAKSAVAGTPCRSLGGKGLAMSKQ
jgi:uncharacterized protein RhaS with RHS repeats